MDAISRILLSLLTLLSSSSWADTSLSKQKCGISSIAVGPGQSERRESAGRYFIEFDRDKGKVVAKDTLGEKDYTFHDLKGRSQSGFYHNQVFFEPGKLSFINLKTGIRTDHEFPGEIGPYQSSNSGDITHSNFTLRNGEKIFVSSESNNVFRVPPGVENVNIFGDHAAYISNGHLAIHDGKKITQIKVDTPRGSYVSKSESDILRVGDNSYVFSSTTRTIKDLSKTLPKDSSSYWFDTKTSLVFYRNGNDFFARNIDTQKNLKLPYGHEIRFGDGRLIVAKDRNLQVFEYQNIASQLASSDKGEARPSSSHTIKNSGGSLSFLTPDILTTTQIGNRLMVFSLKEGKEHLVNPDYRMAASKNGRYLSFTEKSQLKILDMRTGELKSTGVYGAEDVMLSDNGRATFKRFGKPSVTLQMCVDADIKVESAENGCQCTPSGKSLVSADIKDLTLLTMCQADFDKKQWDKIVPADNLQKVTYAEAKNLLLRFQKRGGFEPDKHSKVLASILTQDYIDFHPDLVRGALENVFGSSPDLFKKLLAVFPRLSKVAGRGKALCRTEKEHQALVKATQTYAEQLLKTQNHASTIHDWAGLKILSNLNESWSEDFKADVLSYVGYSLSYGAIATDYDLKGVYFQKLYRYAKEGVKDIFNGDRVDIGEVTTVRTGTTSLKPVILGSRKINGDSESETSFGFFTKKLESIDFDPEKLKTGDTIAEKSIVWTQGEKEKGKDYQSHLQVKLGRSNADIVDRSPSPDYKSLWHKNKLTGVVLIGSNLTGEAAYLPDYYKYYYVDQGFKFDETLQVKSVSDFLKGKVESGKLSYFVKETHAGGDDNNIGTVSKNAKIAIGRKTHADGRTEEIYIIYPDPGAGKDTQDITHQDMETWFKARTENGGGQMIYYNTSCRSAQPAAKEISTVGDPRFVVIPSKSLAYSFNTMEGNPIRILLQSLREGKTYEETREWQRRTAFF